MEYVCSLSYDIGFEIGLTCFCYCRFVALKK